jgi:protein O-GlcNAc transferase
MPLSRPPGRANLGVILQEAMRCHQDGRTAKAERLYREILAADPNNLDAVHLTGVLAAQKKDYGRAVEYLARAAAIAPHIAVIHANLGKAYYQLARFEEALASFERAVQIQPGLADAWNDRGNALRDLGRTQLAYESYERAAVLDPNLPEPWANNADILMDLRNLDAAEHSLARALALRPLFPEGLALRGRLWLLRDQPERARADLERALELRPEYADALALLADTTEQVEVAHDLRQRAVRADPGLVGKLLLKAQGARGQWLSYTAIEYYQRAAALDPEVADAHAQLSLELMLAKDMEGAAAAVERTLEIDPEHGVGHYVRGQVALQTCDWDLQAKVLEHLRRRVAEGKPGLDLSAFGFMCFDTTAAEQLACARLNAGNTPSAPIPAPTPARRTREKIRLAYLSADFQSHATAWLMAGLIELHDRSRFDVIGLSNGPTVTDPTRERLQTAFDRFIDIREMEDEAVVRLMREAEIDIAVDLKGYTQNNRAPVFAQRPAPVQVSFLGYPGTMGVEFIDYLIGDAYVTPKGEEDCYAERIVRLPDSYQVNDNRREIAAATPSRAEQGLPEEGLVFCSFNNTYKITREVFEIWMRLLHTAPGSALWLLGDNDAAVATLKREASARAIAPDRLVFAPRLGQAEHLARHGLADLFLDTLPVNAHTTASDALWAGLPVLTCRGRAFIGRVAASVLAAAGLPELITDNLADYEALALKLAREPAALAGLRRKLAAGRDRCALFDTDRFRRHIEAAYVTMHQRWLDGLPPQAFDVAPID